MKNFCMALLSCMIVAQCSGQDKKPLSDFGSGKEFMAMLQQKNDEEKKRILKEESQLADSTLQLMKSFRGDDAVIFGTPKTGAIEEARNVEKIFEENQVRYALQNGLNNLKIKNFTDPKTGKKDFSIDYNYFGWNDINTGIFLDKTSLEIKKIGWGGKITEKSAWESRIAKDVRFTWAKIEKREGDTYQIVLAKDFSKKAVDPGTLNSTDYEAQTIPVKITKLDGTMCTFKSVDKVYEFTAQKWKKD